MSFEVRMAELPPMRVATTLAFGPSPELAAWEKLAEWARGNHLLKEGYRAFGFNNPSPSPGSPNYGYEVWLEVSPEAEGNEEIRIKQFPGGPYAVTRVVGVEQIFPTWQKLVAWCEDSPYRIGGHQCLEGHINLDFENLEKLTLDLYLPIAK
jgi:AraC family transcriptional regulator